MEDLDSPFDRRFFDGLRGDERAYVLAIMTKRRFLGLPGIVWAKSLDGGGVRWVEVETPAVEVDSVAEALAVPKAS